MGYPSKQIKPLCKSHFALATDSPQILMAYNNKMCFSVLIQDGSTLMADWMDRERSAGLLAVSLIIPESKLEKKQYGGCTVLRAGNRISRR